MPASAGGPASTSGRADFYGHGHHESWKRRSPHIELPNDVHRVFFLSPDKIQRVGVVASAGDAGIVACVRLVDASQPDSTERTFHRFPKGRPKNKVTE